MVVSCVTSPTSLRLLGPTWACAHTSTHIHRRAGTRECKGVVNRKHTGLTRDWGVILDRWPLDVFSFCFTLQLLRRAFASTVRLLPCRESWEILVELLLYSESFFPLNCYEREIMAGGEKEKKSLCVFTKRRYTAQRIIPTTKEMIYLRAKLSLELQPAVYMIAVQNWNVGPGIFTFHSASFFSCHCCLFGIYSRPRLSSLLLGI